MPLPTTFEEWQTLQKCVFDGISRTISIKPGVSSISVKRDIYSAWKEWLTYSDNSKFPPAARVSGGDPIGGGIYTGDVYFLINDWRVSIDHSCDVDGVLFSDSHPSPFSASVGTSIVTNKVSALVNVISTQIDGIAVPTASENATAVWSNISRTLTQDGANNIAAAVRTELTVELNQIMTSNPGLTNSQATMLLELYRLMGLDPTRPLVVNHNQRIVGEITQNINSSSAETIVTRV